MSVEENIGMRKAAHAILELACDEGGISVRFWEIIRDHALKFAPLKEKQQQFRPMTDDEAKRFGRSVVNFGVHRDKCYDDVPLDYLEWLADRNVEVLRYIKSRRIRAEKEQCPRQSS
jgi:hypothetical protein